MKKNMRAPDRIIRLVLATLLVVLFIYYPLSITGRILIAIVVGVLLSTTITGSCPIYHLFGISSKSRDK